MIGAYPLAIDRPPCPRLVNLAGDPAAPPHHHHLPAEEEEEEEKGYLHLDHDTHTPGRWWGVTHIHRGPPDLSYNGCSPV